MTRTSSDGSDFDILAPELPSDIVERHVPPRDEALAKRVPEFTAMAEAMLWSFEHDLKRELPTEMRSAKP